MTFKHKVQLTPKQEKFNVSYASELTAECFDFGIGRLRRCMCRPVVKVIQDGW
jgi:hypothetical protein